MIFCDHACQRIIFLCSHLTNSLAGYRILSGIVFSLNFERHFFHFLPNSSVVIEKSKDILILNFFVHSMYFLFRRI